MTQSERCRHPIVRRSAVVVALLASAILAAPAQAAPGELDASFSGDGRQTTDFFSTGDYGDAVARQRDGKVLLAGDVLSELDAAFGLVRYNRDGSLDRSFSGDGRFSTTLDSGEASAGGVAVQPDGKIVAAGNAAPPGATGPARIAVIRLNPDGSFDRTFGANGRKLVQVGHRSSGTDVTLTRGGRIAVSGTAYLAADDARPSFAVVRLDPDGSLDATFSGDGRRAISFDGRYANPTAITSAVGGRLVLAGQVGTGDGRLAFGFARLRLDGSLDRTLAEDGTQVMSFPGSTDSGAADLALDSEGRAVAVGSVGDGNRDMAAIRLTEDGAPDGRFSGDGFARVDFGDSDGARAVTFDSQGRLVLAGYASVNDAPADFALARLARNGRIDRTFSGDGRAKVDFGGGEDGASEVLVTPNNRIVAAGSAGRGTERDGPSDFAAARVDG